MIDRAIIKNELQETKPSPIVAIRKTFRKPEFANRNQKYKEIIKEKRMVGSFTLFNSKNHKET